MVGKKVREAEREKNYEHKLTIGQCCKGGIGVRRHLDMIRRYRMADR